MDEKKREKRFSLIRLYLYLIGALALGAAVFALCYSAGGANVLAAAATDSPAPNGSASPGGSAGITPEGTATLTPTPAPSTAGRSSAMRETNALGVEIVGSRERENSLLQDALKYRSTSD